MRKLVHVISAGAIMFLAHSVTHAQVDGHLSLRAFPFGVGQVEDPVDLMVDDRGYVWLLDQRATYCMLKEGPVQVHDLPADASIDRWLGVDQNSISISTSSGQTSLPTGEWDPEVKQFLFTSDNSLHQVDLPDGRTVQLTDTGSLVISKSGESVVQDLKLEHHFNLFQLKLNEHARMLFDPRNGIWILGKNGLMLASHLQPTFRTTETTEPASRVTQVVKDPSIDRRFVLSNARGLIVEELTTGNKIRYITRDKDNTRIGGVKWRVLNGEHYLYSQHRVYHYDPVTDNIELKLDLLAQYEGTKAQLLINDFEAHPIASHLYVGTDDNRLFIYDPVSNDIAEHRVKEPGTFSGINLILETEPFGNDRALVIAEHGQFLIDGMNGPVKVAQDEWPGMQFGANFRASGAEVIADTLVVVSSFADGLFIYNIKKDSLYRPNGPDMSELLVTDIFHDGLHHIYGATRTGLLVYNATGNTLTMMNGKHGFPLDNLYYRYMSNTMPGSMCIGLTDRYLEFNTSDLLRTSTDDLFIELLEVNSERNISVPYRPVGTTMELNYLQNNIGLRLGTALKHNSPFTSIFVKLNDQAEQVEFHDDRDVIRFHALAPGIHHIQMAFSHEGPFSELLTVVISPPIWRTWWFLSLIAAGLIGIMYLVFRMRIRHVSKEAKMKAEFDSRIAQLELSSLRAQMHPHFLFNSLNSIKSFIAANEPRTATRYLNKFSQLIRSILNNSRHARVDLRSEVKALQLYLELEQMRFEKSFELSISVAPDIDQDEVTIPPLIFQPYAENAIWHGLMHKEGTRRLDISITRTQEMLQATIKDNGIGRSAAETFKSKTATKHKSLGMKITSEIIQRTHSDGRNGVTINDPFDSNGSSLGTEVIITIPIDHEE